MNQLSHEAIIQQPRHRYLDHLRAALVILVVLHHVAVVYGAAAPFYYVEPPFTSPRAYQVLMVFVLANQSFFMGVLFLLAGYFTPGSYDRKGTGTFVKDKLLRLGVPLVIWVFILNPVSSIGYYLMPPSLSGITTQLTWQTYPKLIGLGPLWFVLMLLIFNAGYVAWRRVTKESGEAQSHSRLSYLKIAVFTLCLAGVSYATRIIVPLGKSVLGFPTLAYLPQYLSFFIVGAVAFRRDWMASLQSSKGIIGFLMAAFAGVFLFPLAFTGKMFSVAVTPALNNAMGAGHWQSALYALWDSIFSVGLCLVLVTFFRRFFDKKCTVGSVMSQQSYAVYIIHTPIIVFLAYLMRGISVGSLAKFGVASILAVFISFVLAFAIKKIPGVSRIL